MTTTKEQIAVLEATLAALPAGVTVWNLHAYAIAKDAISDLEKTRREFPEDPPPNCTAVQFIEGDLESPLDELDGPVLVEQRLQLVEDLYAEAIEFLRVMEQGD